MQTVKSMIKKCKHDGTDLQLALLMYRNTPISTDLKSPAQLMFSRNLRTKVPCIETDVSTRSILKSRQDVSDKYYNKNTRNVRPEFKTGDLVVYRDKLADKIWQQGQVLKPVADSPRSYQIVNSNGNLVRRTSRMLLPDKSKNSMSVIPDNCLPTSSSNTETGPAKNMVSSAKPVTNVLAKSTYVNPVCNLNEPRPRRSKRIKQLNFVPRQSQRIKELVEASKSKLNFKV